MSNLAVVRNCVDSLYSNEVTKKKNGMKQLRDLMNDRTVVQELNRSIEDSNINWTTVFSAVHNLLIKESEKAKHEERKGAQNPAAATRRESWKNDCASLVVIIVKKANQDMPRIKSTVLASCVLEVLSDHYLRENYCAKYTDFIRSNLLPFRESWSKLTEQHWTDLSDAFWKVVRNLPPHCELSAVADVLCGIVKFGGAQSFIGLKLKKKIPIVAELFLDDNFLKASVGAHESLLHLAIIMCMEMGKECRMGVCNLGELIIHRVLHLYDKLSKQKNLVTKFLLLQVRLHHPHGANRSDALGAAYAVDWDLWKSLLKSMFALVDMELSRTNHKKVKDTTICPTFLQLAVEVCKQVFYESSVNCNQSEDTSGCSSSPFLKRKRSIGGIKDIVHNITNVNSPSDSCPWLTFMTEYISRYPESVTMEDYTHVLKAVSEWLNSCRDSTVMGCLCRCCISLLKVDKLLDDDDEHNLLLESLWRKVLETGLRMVGLNQNEKESHCLLQELISHGKGSSAHIDLLELYVKGAVRQSDSALKTLLTLCTHKELPETISVRWRSFLVSESLIAWLLPESRETPIMSPQLLAQVLIIICFKVAPGSTQYENLIQQSNTCVDEVTEIEDNYFITAFEQFETHHGSLMKSESNYSAVHSSSDDHCITLLEDLLKNHCWLCVEDSVCVSEDQKMKDIIDTFLNCEILLCIWSWLIRWNLLPAEKNPSFVGTIKTLIDKLNQSCNKEMFCKQTYMASKFLQCLKHILEMRFHPTVNKELRFIIPYNILKVTFDVLIYLYEVTVGRESEGMSNDFNVEPRTKRITIAQGSTSLFNTEMLSEPEKLQLVCVSVLSSYCCDPGGTKLSEHQDSCFKQLVEWLISKFRMNSTSTFQMAVILMEKVLQMGVLEQKKVFLSLKVLQKMCQTYNHDYEAVGNIMELLQGFFKFIQNYGHTTDKENTAVLLRGLHQLVVRKKQYGPKTVAKFIHCVGELAKVKGDKSWASWKTESKFQINITMDTKSIVEEILFYVQHPFHELRIAAITHMSILFGLSKDKLDENIQWQSAMFDTLKKLLVESFIVEGELSEQECVDESANRTSTVLHSVTAVLVYSSVLRKEALFFLLQLIKDKNISLTLVKKTLAVAGKDMNVNCSSKLIAANLKYLITHWHLKKFKLQEFPWLLLECSSDTDFYTNYLTTLVPVLFCNGGTDALQELCLKTGKHLKDILEICYPHIMGHLLPFFTMRSNTEYHSNDVENAKQLLHQLEEILTQEQVKCLLSENMDVVIVTIFRLLLDVKSLGDLLGYTVNLPESSPPSIKFVQVIETLEYLQENSTAPNLKLIQFLSKNKPSVIQKILLQLAADIYECPTPEEKIISLHRYAVFADLLGDNITDDSMNALSAFIIRVAVHQFVNIIKQGYKENEVLTVLGCRYLKNFLGKCLPAKAKQVENVTGICTSVLVPISKHQGYLAAEALELLKFLVVDNNDCLSTAVGLLGPFPKLSHFKEIQEAYNKIVCGEKVHTLEEEIKYFLDAKMVDSGQHVEGLEHLYIQLSTRKAELRELYVSLRGIRGFSEDCEQSILHQLLCTLIALTSTENREVQLEALRCLGELGPSDLQTLVLQPEKGQYENEDFTEDIIVLLVGCAVKRLTAALVDTNINIIKEASRALYTIMASKEARRFLDSKLSGNFNVSFIFPFLSHKKTRQDSILDINPNTFEELVDCPDLWTPTGECTHETWISNLVCSILQTFSDKKCFLLHLIPVCRVKVTFCEKILPYLLCLVLENKEELCRPIVMHHMQKFFEDHYRTHLETSRISYTAMKKTSTSPEYKSLLTMNRGSVQCMLDVVHFLRMRGHCLMGISDLEMELNFLHISLAAQFCSAYFTSVLYAELWCRSKMRHPFEMDKVSLLEFICQSDKENGQILQHVLWEAYSKMGDTDAVYGCWPPTMINSQNCVQHFKQTAKWDRALQMYDLELASGNNDAAPGLLNALQKFGLRHVINGYINAPSVREQLSTQKTQKFYYDCAWRLSKWNADIYSDDKNTENYFVSGNVRKHGLHSDCYERFHYLALNALQNSDEHAFKIHLENARACVIDSLAHASLETSKCLYTVLSQLQSLQEMEDFFSETNITDSNNFEAIIRKWKEQDHLKYNDFEYLEPTLSQRIVMLKIAEKKSPHKKLIQSKIANLCLDIATLARTEGHFQVASQNLQILKDIPNLTYKTAVNLKLEEARLLWDRGDREIAMCILKVLLGNLEKDKGESHVLALRLYGDWLVETKSENAQVIMNQFFMKSMDISDGISCENKVEIYWSVACFADSQYQQLNSYFKSAEYEAKYKCMEKALSDVQHLRKQAEETGPLSEEERRAFGICDRQTKLDRTEIENRKKERDSYLTTAIRYYIQGLEYADDHDLQVFRVAHLWLENTTHMEVNNVLDKRLFRIPSYKFLPLLPQLIPHMSHTEDKFSRKINMLIEQCGVDHPHHSLPQILALANSHKDKQFCGINIQTLPFEPRVVGAQQMVERLIKNPLIGELLQQMQILSTALISLAYYSQKDKSKSGRIPGSEPIMKLKKLENVLVPTLNLPVKPNNQYNNIIGIAGFQNSFNMVGGVNAPKKIVCIGTDGIERAQLVKGRDDLRQDAVMQQVFTMMNIFLRKNKETSKRKLLMRTYKVVPLSQRSGVIEWCDNTEVLAMYLIGSDLKSGAHTRYYPSDFTAQHCRTMIRNVASDSNERKLQVYLKICTKFSPVFHKFFLENFPAPSVWFERRLAYIHSAATSSMIGYILGLGDRHLNNILIDKTTAEVIHIDFGIAFEMGRILPTPETVPFRLTRDIVDGMGASGVEGVFRRCCEKTMTVLRDNQETILTILEVLLYDPLYAWSITPKKAYTLQCNSGSSADETYAEEDSSVEVNKMAERALLRLRQKLHGTEEGRASSVSGQVNHLIQQATDPVNLSRLYNGWQAYL